MLSKCPQALPQGCSARAGGTDCAPLRPHPGCCSQTPGKHPKGAGVIQSQREDSGSGPAAGRWAAVSTAQGWFPPRSGVGVPTLQPRKPRCHVTPQLLGELGLLGLHGTRDSHPTAVHANAHSNTHSHAQTHPHAQMHAHFYTDTVGHTHSHTETHTIHTHPHLQGKTFLHTHEHRVNTQTHTHTDTHRHVCTLTLARTLAPPSETRPWGAP